MRKTVTEPEKVVVAHDSMRCGDLSTPLQPMHEVPPEEGNILQDALQVSARKKIRRLAVMLAAVVGVALAAPVVGVGVMVVVAFDVLLSKTKLLSPPGSWARAVLSFVFSKKTFDNVYAQAIADMREEHFEALDKGRLWKARWIVLAYYINLVLAVSAWFGTSVLQKVVGLWKIGL